MYSISLCVHHHFNLRVPAHKTTFLQVALDLRRHFDFPTCILDSSVNLLPQASPGCAPEWEWINNMKVWLDVWDPASGFHFPDKRAWMVSVSSCLATFFKKAGTESGRKEHQTRTQQKGSDPLSLGYEWTKKEVCYRWPLCWKSERTDNHLSALLMALYDTEASQLHL